MPPLPPPQSDEGSFRKVMLHIKQREQDSLLPQSDVETTGGAPSEDKSVVEALVLRCECIEKESARLDNWLDRPEYKEWVEAKGLKQAMPVTGEFPAARRGTTWDAEV